MSNDLISRRAVIDVIKRHECDTSRIAEGVMELPAAYDVDKVLDRLEVNSMFAQVDDEPFVMLDDAVEIVKSGGIE